jgi:hypothetical protein
MPSIRKALITEFGDESKVIVVEGEVIDPSAEEVQVEVEYAGFSGADINMRRAYILSRKRHRLPPDTASSAEYMLTAADVANFNAVIEWPAFPSMAQKRSWSIFRRNIWWRCHQKSLRDGIYDHQS